MRNQVIFGARFISPGLLLAGLIFLRYGLPESAISNRFSNPALLARG